MKLIVTGIVAVILYVELELCDLFVDVKTPLELFQGYEELLVIVQVFQSAYSVIFEVIVPLKLYAVVQEEFVYQPANTYPLLVGLVGYLIAISSVTVCVAGAVAVKDAGLRAAADLRVDLVIGLCNV